MQGTLKTVVFLIIILFISLASWFLTPSKGKKKEIVFDEKLVIITPHWDGIRNEFAGAFEKWYKGKTGRKVSIEYLDQGGTSDDVRYILSEFKRSPNGIGIDIFFGGGSSPYLTLKDAGCLSPVIVSDSVLSAVPQNFSGIAIYDTGHCWYGAALSGFGIVYNKWVTEWMGFSEPSAWADLANPKYYSWIGAADPRNSGTMHMMFEIILQAYGWEQGWKILTGVAANTKNFFKGANEVPKMVAQGDIAFGLSIDFYGWTQVSQAGEDKVGFIMPPDLTVIDADAIAMLKGAPNPEASKMFIEFVLSEAGQKLWYFKKGVADGPVKQELNRMPVRMDMYGKYANMTAVKQNPFERPNDFRFNSLLANKRWIIINDIFGIALIDNGKELKKGWENIIRKNINADSLIASMPLTEEECAALAENVWKNSIEKNRILMKWQNFFRDKYKKLAKM